MTEGTRSFNAKRSRLTAAEVRRKVLEGSYIAGSQPESFDPNAMSSSTIQRIILTDIANPVDVEEALSSRVIARTEIKAVSSSPQRIRDLTEKDVDIVVIPRNKCIQNPAIIEALSSDSVETKVKDFICSFETDFTVVERRYQTFSSAESYSRMSQQRKQIAEINPKQIFENDIPEIEAAARIPLRSVSQVGDHPPHGGNNNNNRESTISIESNGSSGSKDDSQSQQLHSSTYDPIVPNVTLKLSRTQIDETNEKKRFTNRSNYLINLLPLESEAELNVEASFEPLFASAALYDINEKKKLSENFYFDLNSEDLLSLVRGHLGLEEEASKCRQAMFSVTDIRPGLFLVFKLEKILQSCDIGEAIEPYTKEEKNKEKLLQNAKDYCTRLGNYRMPFGWAVLDLNAVLLNASNLLMSDMGDSTNRIDEELESIGGGSSYHETESIISADRISTMTSETLQHTASSATITSQILDTPTKKRSFFTSSAAATATTPSIQHHQQQQPTIAENNLMMQQRISKIESLQPLIVNVNSFYKQDSDRLTDDELIKILIEARKSNSKLGRLKAIPIELKLELSLMKLDEIPAKLSAELIPMQPFVREISDPLTKDILPFAKAKDFTVNTFYRNLLYIHPKHVNFSARPGNARNICIRMQLMDSHSKPLKVVFGKSSTSNFSDKSYTSVLYHNKSPQFGDETKFQLPVDLNDGHHILFTFLHISCKPGKLSETLETPIGYTWHPLYRNGQLQTGEFALPISLEPLPSSICYLSPFVNVPSIKWLDSHKPLFQVSITAVSTIHPQDEFLATFFTTFQALKSDSKKPNIPIPTEARMIDVVKGVIKAPPQPLANFLYAILDRILTLIGCEPFTAALTQACFETLCHLVKVCTMLLDNSVDNLGRSQILTTYLNFYKITTSDCLKAGQDETRKGSFAAPLAGFEDIIISSPRNSARDSC
uniref:C2 DOCK-type domain-containing protein n=1 Tax=Panagrolaimus superbus TaxID=310955 RepID=A0A914Z118_9BILA